MISRGLPSKLGEFFDGEFKEFVVSDNQICVVNSRMFFIITHEDIELTKDCNKSIMGRLGLSKRKVIRHLKTLPTDLFLSVCQ